MTEPSDLHFGTNVTKLDFQVKHLEQARDKLANLIATATEQLGVLTERVQKLERQLLEANQQIKVLAERVQKLEPPPEPAPPKPTEAESGYPFLASRQANRP